MTQFFVRRLFITVSVAGFLLVLFGMFIKKTEHKEDTQRPYVVCTIGMIADVAKQLAGDHLTIESLMGPGVDPHLYKARESDVHRLVNADLILFNGLHLEGKMGDLFSSMYKKAVPVAEIIAKRKLIEADFQGAYDPHVWHDVLLWADVTEKIAHHLIALDPGHAQFYQERLQQYLKELLALDAYVVYCAHRLSSDRRILVTAHDAFNYFGKRYGFEVIGLQGISTDAEISAKDIQNLADFIVRKKVTVLFVESSIPQKNIEAVQHAVAFRGWQVAIGPELFSDALGDRQTGADTYCRMIKHNIESIVGALGN